ncbi:MAG: hypothetical protein D6719_06115 [Candidatus Dadabacteria bacterium]|nr:MAG: hypothetical protein D6719_06115 [Candidatus Dadabacteria bacterium]
MDIRRFRALSSRHRALVAVATLLDGHEASVYLESDAVHGGALSKAAAELAAQDPELRMPLIGSFLRGALGDLAAKEEAKKE